METKQIYSERGPLSNHCRSVLRYISVTYWLVNVCKNESGCKLIKDESKNEGSSIAMCLVMELECLSSIINQDMN